MTNSINYCFRDFSLDFSPHVENKEERAELFASSNYLGQCKRVALASLPILSLSPKVQNTLNLFSNSTRSVTSIKDLYYCKNNLERIPAFYHSALSVASLVSTVFVSSASMAITTGHDISIHIFRLATAIKNQQNNITHNEIKQIVNHALYLIFLLYGSLEIQALSLLIQVITEGLACLDEYKDKYYVEAISHLLMTALRAHQLKQPTITLGKKWKTDLICQKAAWQMYSLAHTCAIPAHDLSYSCYLISSGKLSDYSTTEKVSRLTKNLFEISIITPITIASLGFSAMGSLAVKFSGKDYLYYEQNPDYSSGNHAHVKGMTYNIGELPGELSEKVTVRDDFPYTYHERKEKIADYLAEQLKQKDLITLQEAIDFRTIELIKDRLNNSSFCLYARIGKPFYPGISSGIAILSKKPLPNFTVKTLPENEPFFNRSFVSFTLPDESLFVTGHLRTGYNDVGKMKQMQYIASEIDQTKRIIFAGDFNNFNDDCSFSQTIDNPKQFKNYITEETLYNPSTIESHPDVLAELNPLKDRNIDYTIHKEIDFSDHFPISFTVPMKKAIAEGKDIS